MFKLLLDPERCRIADAGDWADDVGGVFVLQTAVPCGVQVQGRQEDLWQLLTINLLDVIADGDALLDVELSGSTFVKGLDLILPGVLALPGLVPPVAFALAEFLEFAERKDESAATDGNDDRIKIWRVGFVVIAVQHVAPVGVRDWRKVDFHTGLFRIGDEMSLLVVVIASEFHASLWPMTKESVVVAN